MKTSNEWVNIINDSVEKGLRKESKIEDWIFNIKSFSTHEIKCFMNNLCSHGDINYLEVGAYKGGTACSAVSHNELLTSYIVDNFSEFTIDNAREVQPLTENLNKISNTTKNITFIDKDCYQITTEEIPEKIDVYFYDGAHEEEDQYKALNHYLEFMKDTFVFIVDDYNGEEVKVGTKRSLEFLKDKINVEKEWVFETSGNMQPIWWNGLYIAVISKKTI